MSPDPSKSPSKRCSRWATSKEIGDIIWAAWENLLPLPPPWEQRLPVQDPLLPPQEERPIPLKEPRNVPQPEKFDGDSSKLKAFVNDCERVYERMPITYHSEWEKILFMASLLTGNAKKWYLANKKKGLPNAQTDWTVWARYSELLAEFVRVHKNKNKVREAKRNLQMEYQKQGESIKVYVTRMRTHNLVTNLPADQIWDYLVNGVLAKVREYMR